MQLKPLARVLILALAASSLLASTASADSASCAAAPEAGRVMVLIHGDPTVNEPPALIQRDGEIWVADVDDPGASCGLATEIDQISIRSADKPGFPGLIFIDTSEPVGPGATDEPGDSDEIEIDAYFEEGAAVGIKASRGPVRITTGGPQVNLNRSEKTGVDGDLTLRGIEFLVVDTTIHRDVVDGAGGEGTGPRRGAFRIHSEAPVLDIARDILLGTSRMDHLYGGSGNDLIRGGAMADRVYGGRGNDRLFGGRGSDVIRGGGGSDSCSEPDDYLLGCELGAG